MNGMIHGTPYHYDLKYPFKTFGSNSDFNSVMQPAHQFVIPLDYNPKDHSKNYLMGIYHGGDIQGWTNYGNNTLLGVLGRNTPGTGCFNYGAEGTDPGEHIINYAIRIPSKLASPHTAQPLKESLQYQSPLISFPLTSFHSNQNIPSSSFPTSFSMASILSPSSAIITAAKSKTSDPSQIIFRIYKADNTPSTIEMMIGGALVKQPSASIVTALETPYESSKSSINQFSSSNNYNLTIWGQYAITSLQFG